MQFCTTERPQLFEFEVASCRTCRLRSKKAILKVATSNLQKWRGSGQSWGPCMPIWNPLIVYLWIMSLGRVVEFWNWHQILKCLFIFLFFAGSKRRTKCSAVFLLKSPTLFYTLKVPQNTFHSNIKKIFWYSTSQHQLTTCPNDMIHAIVTITKKICA